LPRSTACAQLLGVSADLIDPVYREAELPAMPWSGPKMHAGRLSVWARAAWVCGYSLDCETYGAARGRAERGADRLIELALSHQQVLLVGHGMMNRMIGKMLRKRKWRSVRAARVNRYWGISTYLPSSEG
tara:strand:+ start:4368 stop:4757 length:390 start_codon:yes stop_codon:yes gene_type:complete